MKDFFVVNDGNEEELIDSARSLNINDFVLLYSFDNYLLSQKKNKERNVFNDKIKCGILLDSKDKSQIKKALQLTEYVVVKATTDLRLLLENFKKIHVYNIETSERQDFMHFRNSNMNHILAKIAKENKIKILFSFTDFLKLSDSKKALVLGRLKQNSIIYNKVKVDFAIASFASNNYEIKSNLSFFEKFIESNKADDITLEYRKIMNGK